MPEPQQDKDNSHNRYDKAYKTLLRNPEVFCQFMRSLVKEDLVQNLQPDQLQAVDKSFINSKHKETESDLIYKVALTPEQDAYFYILMELQSSVDDKMPLRMLEYVTQLYRVSADDKRLKAQGKKLPAIFPIVFYNGDKVWRQSAQIADMIDGGHVPSRFIPKMEYLLIDLSQFADTDLDRMDNLVAAITYAENHGKTAEFEAFITELIQYIVKLLPEESGLFKRWFLGAHKAKLNGGQLEQLTAILENTEYGKDNNMMTNSVVNFMDKHYSRGLLEGRQEGEELGLRKGEELGLRRGKQEGEASGRRDTARNMLAEGFGIEQIMRITGLNQEEIQQLQQES